MNKPSILVRGHSAVVLASLSAFVVLSLLVWRLERLSFQKKAALPAPAAVLAGRIATADETDSAQTTRFLLARLKNDHDDFLAQNMLAGMMLQKVRETGSADYLQAALRAATASLASVPAERNAGGLSSKARAEMAAHDFVQARADGERLTKLHPENLGSWSVLADALLELGEYAKADFAIQEMRTLGSDTAETEIRLGRLLFLQGDTAGSQKHFFRALAFALNVPATPHETIAWCQWQLGETAFSTADYPTAERYYRAALKSFPGYVQALASLGRLLAGQGDLPGAIERYEEAVRRFPDPTLIGALGDLYALSGRAKDAETQYALVQQIGRLTSLDQSRYNRQIALFDADHNKNLAAAYANAAREYQDRRDIYGADALAWTALKAGRTSDARQAMAAALRMSTRDAKLYYHAGMIARTSGDTHTAEGYLRRAIKLNPYFDPLGAADTKKALDAM